MVKKNKFFLGLSFLGIFFGSSFSFGANSVAGISFPDNAQVGNIALTLNGVGLRTATLFKVKVYAAALYLPKKSTAQDFVLDPKTTKRLDMKFLRSIDASDLQKAWSTAFQDNCKSNCDALRVHLDGLNGWMSSVNEGDSMTYEYSAGSLAVSLNGVEKGKVVSEPFSQIVFSAWVGEKPPTEALKTGLLGKE